MKFFTPDLIERFGSEDEEIALAAHDEFEDRSEEYVRRRHQIRGGLPERFRELQDRFYLHDAQVMMLYSPAAPVLPGSLALTLPSSSFGGPEAWKEGTCWPHLWIAVQLDPPPREHLILQYRAVVVERNIEHASIKEEQCPCLEWLYDEIDVDPTEQGKEFVHSILLTSGTELRLRFKGFEFASPNPMEQILSAMVAKPL